MTRFRSSLVRLRVRPLVLGALVFVTVGCVAPTDPVALHNREGDAALAEGRPAQALAAYRAALALSPDDREALGGVLEAEVARRAGEEALLALRAVDARDDGAASADVRCAALLLGAEARLGRADATGALEAARAYGTAGCSEGPHQTLLARAWVAAADGDRAAGRTEPALHAYRAAIEADPSRADVFRTATSLMLAEGRSDEAIALLAVALEHHPENRQLRDMMIRALATD